MAPSKKRPAEGSRVGDATVSTQAPTRADESARHTIRSRSGSRRPTRNQIMGTMQRGTNIDSERQYHADFGTFAPNFQYSNLGLPPGSPESLGGPVLRGQTNANLQHRGAGAVHRLDAMMFPSDDPLAYPNPTRVDLGQHRPGVPTASPGGMPQHDPSQYYMPNIYDGIEGQLFGPLPPYLVQAQTHAPPPFGFPTQMYSGPMIPSQRIPHSQNQHHEHQHHETHQGQQSHQTENFDDIVNAQWNGIFP